MTELAMHAADRDIADALCEQVRSAYDARTPLRIVGGDTRAFYGRPVEGQALSVAEHSGIVSYDPVELIVTVREENVQRWTENFIEDLGKAPH